MRDGANAAMGRYGPAAMMRADMTSLLELPGVRCHWAKEVRENRDPLTATRWTQSCPRTGGVLHAADTLATRESDRKEPLLGPGGTQSRNAS